MNKTSTLAKSVLALLLCVAMLAGITVTCFAAHLTDTQNLMACHGTSRMEMGVNAQTGNEELGLAFLFSLKATGVTRNEKFEGNYNEGKVGDGYDLVTAGAVVTNKEAVGTNADDFTLDNLNTDKTVIDVEAAKLFYDPNNAEHDGYGTHIYYAVRITNIPVSAKGIAIYARPYYVYEDGDGEQITVYGDIVNASYEKTIKFTKKFDGDFLYRVGNQNTVAVGYLFKENFANIDDEAVSVDIETIAGTAASGTYAGNTSDWTQGTIQFSGTGVVKVTITDADTYCLPTELYLEVVDAVNATSATNATTNNVVLLQDAGFSSLEVSGGYALYGNGFTLECKDDGVAIDRTYSFVELDNGTLDNVQIIAPNFSHSILYEGNKTEGGNPSNTDSTGRTRYYNIRSAVVMKGNSKITNSFVSGGRAAVYCISGNPIIENSTIKGGAAANIHVEQNNNLTLKDVTLIQKPIQATVNDTSKTVMGFSVIAVCDTNGDGAPITLEGTLRQYAWAHKGYSTYVPEGGEDVIQQALNKTEYLHQITYADGTTADSVNLGFVYMPDGMTTANFNLTDNRTNSDQNDVPYGNTSLNSTRVQVYTYKNTNGTHEDVQTEPVYSPNKQNSVRPSITYTDANENREFSTAYDAVKGWTSTLKVDVDAGVYTFSFDNLLAQKYGKNLNYTIKDVNGNAVEKSATITLNSSASYEYVLEITDNLIYDQDGNWTDSTAIHTHTFILLSTKTSLPAPTWTSTTLNGTPYIVVDSKNGDWNCAVPVLDGLKVKYWSKKQSKEIELDLANVVTDASLSSGLQNGSNNTITITVADEYTLTITTSGFKTNDNGKPVVVNDKLYFTVSSSSNYVSTKTESRTPSISYVFTDANNSDSITLSTSMTVTYATYKSKQYKYSDFCNGTLTEASSCLTADTLVTLADGSQVRVDALTGSEELLVWNHETGKLDKAPIAYIIDHDGVITEREIIHLTFGNGKTVKIIGEHVFFDATQNKYIAIDTDNADSLIGHTFAALNADGTAMELVELISVQRETTETLTYEVVSYKHLTCFTEGILSTSAYLDPLLNVFDIDADSLAYTTESVVKDIETYGLYTYADFEGLISEEAFELYNAQYLKIAVGKGYITWDDIQGLIDIYFNVDVQPIQ